MYRRNRFRIGAIVLSAGSLFVLMLLFILGGSLSGPSAKYSILFEENVKGMVIGSRCNFQGVPIGSVHDIRFQDGLTLVTVLVDPDKAVIQDVTRARLDRLLVTGQVTVELEGYEPGAKRLKPGAFIEPKADPIHSMKNSLPELAGEFLVLTQELKGSVQRFNRLLDTNVDRINKMMENAERTSTTVSSRLDGLMEQARATLDGFDKAARAMETLASGPELKGTLEATAGAMRTLERLEARIDSVMVELQGVLGGVRGPALTAVTTLREALEEFRGLARQLRLAPNSLIYGVTPPAAPGGNR